MKYITLLMCLVAMSTNATEVVGGKTVLRAPTTVVGVSIQQLSNNSFHTEESVIVIGSSTFKNVDVPSKYGVSGRVYKDFQHLSVGFGVIYFNHVDRLNGSTFNFWDTIRYRFTNHYSVEYVHISNAGITSPNTGRDMVLVGYKF